MIKETLFMLGSILIANHLYAASAYVICVTQEKKWDWLKENGNYTTVSGEWKSGERGAFRFHYFKLTEETRVEDLQRKCKNFDEKYVYAQPANSNRDYWYVFGTDLQNLSAGFIDYCLIRNKYQTLMHDASFCIIKQQK